MNLLYNLRQYFNSLKRNRNNQSNSNPSPDETNNNQSERSNYEAKIFKIIDDILQHIDTYYADVLKKGKEDGEALTIDLEAHLTLISDEFDSINVALNGLLQEIKEKEKAYATAKEEKLNIILAQLNEDLDITNEKSKLSFLTNELTSAKENLINYNKNLYETEFKQKYYEFLDKRLEEEYSTLSGLRTQEQTIANLITKELDIISSLLSNLHSNLNANNRDEILSTISKIKEIIKDLPITVDKLHDYYYEQNGRKVDVLSRATQLIADDLNGVQKVINKIKPLLSPRALIIILYVISFTILLGEFFLIDAFLIDLIDDGNRPTFSSNPLGFIARYVFCFAYPLGLGMLFKARITNQDDMVRKLTWWIIFISIIGVFAISFPNVLKILNLEKLKALSVIEWIQFIGLSTFLGILTLLLSASGAIVFHEAVENHKIYYHTSRNPLLIKKGKNTTKQELENEILSIQQKIDALYTERKALIEELSNLQSIANTDLVVQNYYGIINALKSNALHSYQRGFEQGRDKILKEMDEADLTVYKLRQGIITGSRD